MYIYIYILVKLKRMVNDSNNEIITIIITIMDKCTDKQIDR